MTASIKSEHLKRDRSSFSLCPFLLDCVHACPFVSSKSKQFWRWRIECIPGRDKPAWSHSPKSWRLWPSPQCSHPSPPLLARATHQVPCGLSILSALLRETEPRRSQPDPVKWGSCPHWESPHPSWQEISGWGVQSSLTHQWASQSEWFQGWVTLVYHIHESCHLGIGELGVSQANLHQPWEGRSQKNCWHIF